MANAISYQAAQASGSNTAGSTTTGSWFQINYGVSGIAQITNGGTGPTVGCSVFVDVATDGSGTNASNNYLSLGTAPTTNSGGPYYFPFGLGKGFGADAGYYRVRFTGNTGQAVTVQADAWTTTSL